MILLRSNRTRGFTIIELLVVIAIIIVVAGLVVGLGGVATSSQRTKRAEAEKARLVTLIDIYKSKIGIYPPGTNVNYPHLNTLLYELAGAKRVTNGVSPSGVSYSAANPGFETKFQTNASSELYAAFRIKGVINSFDPFAVNDDPIDVKRLLKNLKPDQFASVVSGTLSLVVPVDGPNGKPNPWNYLVGSDAVHNPSSYDLWVDIIAGGKTVRIANWKE